MPWKIHNINKLDKFSVFSFQSGILRQTQWPKNIDTEVNSPPWQGGAGGGF